MSYLYYHYRFSRCHKLLCRISIKMTYDCSGLCISITPIIKTDNNTQHKDFFQAQSRWWEDCNVLVFVHILKELPHEQSSSDYEKWHTRLLIIWLHLGSLCSTLAVTSWRRGNATPPRVWHSAWPTSWSAPATASARFIHLQTWAPTRTERGTQQGY